MSQHMVIFQTADGSPAYSQFESISEAVGFVESLRNDQGIENARMFELKEIKFELKPVFKVELKELNPAPSASAPSSAPSAPQQSAPAPSPAPSRPEPAPAPAPAAAPSSGETTSFGGSFAPPSGPAAEPAAPAAPAPTPPADQPSSDSQPARRGLFGR